MKKHADLLAALILALFLHSCAVSVAPMQPNIKAGGRAVSVTRHPSNNNEFFVASESGGLFKSTDGGLHWNQVSGATTFGFTDVKYCTHNPGIVIAAAQNDTKTTTGGGIYRSTNSGGAWSQIAISTPNPGCGASISAYCIAVEPGNNKIWVGTSCGLAVSTDDGATFSFVAASGNYHNEPVYAVLAPVQNNIKILTDAGVKVSTNDGASWLFSTTGLPYVDKGEHAQIACSPLNHQHIFWASNFSPYDGKWHYGIYYSSDNGNTWTNLIDHLGINRRPTCFTALSLSGSNKFDLYFSDGGCTLQRAAFSNTTPPGISGAWTNLNHPHCDFADLCFKTDGKTPAILAGDGGLFSTSDAGANWAFTGGGANGYNALQITEVIGQKHSSDGKSDLYYGTQDNDIRSSPDEGATWPDANAMCCEGFFLNIPRDYVAPSDTKFTGVDCGPCGNFMTPPLIAGGGGFPNLADANSNPRLLKPGAYIQSNTLPGAPSVSIFNLTTNNGGSWTPKYAFTNEIRDLSKVSGKTDPVIFTAVKFPGSTPDGEEIVRMKKIVGVLSGSTPIVSDVSGFGSIGIFPTMFAWYKPFGVNIRNANHLIVPDITTDKVRKTFDGGITWTDDNTLTNLVTGSGVYKFRWGPFTQISTIAFDPDVSGRILVGTVQNGICYTCDNGASWNKLAGSESIPNVSSFYFLGKNRAVAASYGRGLWKLYLPKCPRLYIPRFPVQLDEPLIYWKGAYIPISQIKDPEVCPVCGFYLIEGGEIVQVILTDNNEVRSVFTSGNNRIQGFNYEGKVLDNLFERSQSGIKFDPGQDQNLAALLLAGYKVKGIYLEGRQFKGYIMSKTDVKQDQLPRVAETKAMLKSNLMLDTLTGSFNGVKLTLSGFRTTGNARILIDGKPMDQNLIKTEKDVSGNTVYSLNSLLTPGGHKIVLEQDGPNGTTREVTTIVVPLNDDKNRRRQ